MSKFHMSWKNVLLHIVLCLALCIVFLTGVLYWLTDDPQAFIGFLCNYRTVKADYYEPVSDRVLFEGAVNGMVKSLGDPYSTYLTGEKLNSFIQGINGEYHGIGIIIGFTIDKEPVILYVIPNSPAASAGLKSGDVLKSVDGKSIDGWEPNAISQSIQGESGTSVKIGYTRGSESYSSDIIRSDINIPSVSSSMASPDTGYIHIFIFAKNTPSEFKQVLADLKSKGMQKLIIDLRMNPGGSIESVVDIADQILSKGLVLSYIPKNGAPKQYDIEGISNPMPMAILVDRNSASASEILAGAVQARHEGLIIGETTFGKGTIQDVIFENDQDAALKISIGEYKTADGKKINKVGITPDIKISQDGKAFDAGHDSVLQFAVKKLQDT